MLLMATSCQPPPGGHIMSATSWWPHPVSHLLVVTSYSGHFLKAISRRPRPGDHFLVATSWWPHLGCSALAAIYWLHHPGGHVLATTFPFKMCPYNYFLTKKYNDKKKNHILLKVLVCIYI